MSFVRPTIAELAQQQTVDLSAQLGIPQPQVMRSNAGVLAKVQAGGLHCVHGHLAYLVEQQLEDTAEVEYLRRKAGIRDITEKAATKATGTRVINGTDGAAVTAGELLQRTDGQQFTVAVGATIVGGTASIDLEALDAGAAGNTDASEALTFVTPVAGINSTSPTGELAGGSDAETDESLRARILADIREPPHGGADRDYTKWVKETPGVNVHRVWVMRKWMGAGTVGVFFTVNDGAIPDAASVTLVSDYVIDQAPVTAEVFVIAPTAAAVPITISGLTPDTPTIRAAITAELQDLFTRKANMEDGTGSGTMLLSHIREAISIASGETDHAVTVPASDVTFAKGDLPQLGAITWT